MQVYTTKQDALDYALLPALQEYAGDSDVDAIFEDTFTWVGNGYVQSADIEDFWAAVERAEL